MNTIQERASIFAGAYPRTDDVDLPYFVKEAYIAAATEQRTIEIEKACDAFCKSQCGKVTSGCMECGKYKVFRKDIEK